MVIWTLWIQKNVVVLNAQIWIVERPLGHIWNMLINYGRLEWVSVCNNQSHIQEVKRKVMDTFMKRRCRLDFFATIEARQPK